MLTVIEHKENIMCFHVNLNKNRAAQTLLEHTFIEEGIDIVQIMEPNKKIA